MAMAMVELLAQNITELLDDHLALSLVLFIIQRLLSLYLHGFSSGHSFGSVPLPFAIRLLYQFLGHRFLHCVDHPCLLLV